MSAATQKRQRALRSLLELELPLQSVLGDLAGMAWDIDEELVTLRPEHVIAILERFMAGALNAEDVEKWANAIEGREDIALDPGSRSLLKAVIFDLANPALQGALTRDAVQHWIERLATVGGQGGPEG